MKKKCILFLSLILCVVTCLVVSKKSSALTINQDATINGSNFIDFQAFYQDAIDDVTTIEKTITINNQQVTAFSTYNESGESEVQRQTTYLTKLNNVFYVYVEYVDYAIDDNAIYFNLFDNTTYNIHDYFYPNFDDTTAFNSPNYALNLFLIKTNIQSIERDVSITYIDTTFEMSGTNNARAFSNLSLENETAYSSFWFGNYDYDFISWNPSFEIQTDTNFDNTPNNFYFLFSINSGGNPIPEYYDNTKIIDKWYSSDTLNNAYNTGYNQAKEDLENVRKINNQLTEQVTNLQNENQRLEQEYEAHGTSEYNRGFQEGLSETTDLSTMDAVFEFFKNMLRGFKGVLDVRLFGYFSVGNILSFFVILLLFKWVIDLWR